LVLHLQFDGSACLSPSFFVGHDVAVPPSMLGPVGRAVNSARARVGLRPLVWGAILTVVALGLDFVPLYDLLGYDFAFAVGFVAALAGVDIGHGALARARARLERAPAGAELGRVFGQAAALSGATLVLPLLLGSATPCASATAAWAPGWPASFSCRWRAPFTARRPACWRPSPRRTP